MASAKGSVVSAKIPLGILVNVCGIMESSLVVVRRVLREFFGAMASLRQSALVVASVNSIGNGTELHRSVCALDALLQQIERIRPVTGKRDIGQHIRHECSCRRDLPIAMRLLQQAEYHIVYITAPTTAPRGDELKNFVRGGNVVVQFILLRSEVEDIQSTADSVMALVDATADMPSVSIVQSEDTLIDVRNTMKPWLRKLQAHMTAVVRWPPSSPDDMSATSLQLVLRSSFSLHETQESQWHLLHAGLAHLTALHVVPLDSVDGSVVIGLPLTSDAASDPCVDPVAVNMHYFLRTNQSGIVVKCRNKATSALEFYLLVAAGTTYSSQCPFMMYRLAPTDQVLLPPPTTHEPFDLPPIDTSFNPSIPNQRFNPFDYDSGVGDVTTHVVTPVPIVVAPQAVLPPARSLKTKARRFL